MAYPGKYSKYTWEKCVCCFFDWMLFIYLLSQSDRMCHLRLMFSLLVFCVDDLNTDESEYIKNHCFILLFISHFSYFNTIYVLLILISINNNNIFAYICASMLDS